jgi:hypothetical protein
MVGVEKKIWQTFGRLRLRLNQSPSFGRDFLDPPWSMFMALGTISVLRGARERP